LSKAKKQSRGVDSDREFQVSDKGGGNRRGGRNKPDKAKPVKKKEGGGKGTRREPIRNLRLRGHRGGGGAQVRGKKKKTGEKKGGVGRWG